MSKKDILTDPHRSPPCNGLAQCPTASTSSNGVDPPSPPHSPLPARDPHPSASDPQLSLPSAYHTPNRLSTQSVTSLTSSRPAPPSPAVSRRASGLSRSCSRPVSGMSSAASSRPVSGVQSSRPVSGASSRPISETVQPIPPITTTTTASMTTSLNPSANTHDRRPSLASTITPSDDTVLSPAEPTPRPAQASTTTTPVLIQIRDYGFAPTDPRFSGQGPHVPRVNRPAVLARRLASSSKSDDGYETEEESDSEKMNMDAQSAWEGVVDNGTNGWGGFKWGFGRAWQGFPRASGLDMTPTGAGFPSRGDLDRNFGGEDEDGDEDEEMEVEMEEGEVAWDDEGDDEMDADGEAPLFPGLYRALYAFEPEGTAEMKLDEDQLVRVIGRGGGVGWAVVVKDGLKDSGVHALVPESYLELVRLDGEEEDA